MPKTKILGVYELPSMSPLPAKYDLDNDRWLLTVPFGLPDSAVRSAADYIFKVNHDRWLSASGDKREFIGKALKALQEGRIVQVVADRGDQVIFQSTEKMNPDRTIFTPAGAV